MENYRKQKCGLLMVNGKRNVVGTVIKTDIEKAKLVQL